jgi:hypothetical protein
VTEPAELRRLELAMGAVALTAILAGPHLSLDAGIAHVRALLAPGDDDL